MDILVETKQKKATYLKSLFLKLVRSYQKFHFKGSK